MTEKKPRRGASFGKLVDRVVYPRNVHLWPLDLFNRRILVGQVIGSRVADGQVVLTLECHGGVVYDGLVLGTCLLAEEGAHVCDGDSFLVKVNPSEETNLRRVVYAQGYDVKSVPSPGTTRLAKVDRTSGQELAP